ncbi:MAG: universal stress protein [Kineosporiaceae bacterium]
MTGPLYRHIGCCIDDSPASASALTHARELWSPAAGRLSLVHVAPRPLIFDRVDGSPVPSPRDISSLEREWLRARAGELPGSEPVFLEGMPGREICRWAEEAAVDLLVAGRNHGGWGTRALGSVTRHLVDHAPCPVLVVNPVRAPRSAEPASAA